MVQHLWLWLFEWVSLKFVYPDSKPIEICIYFTFKWNLLFKGNVIIDNFGYFMVWGWSRFVWIPNIISILISWWWWWLDLCFRNSKWVNINIKVYPTISRSLLFSFSQDYIGFKASKMTQSKCNNYCKRSNNLNKNVGSPSKF